MYEKVLLRSEPAGLKYETVVGQNQIKARVENGQGMPGIGVEIKMITRFG